jgi:hypothetical protein
MEEVIDSKEITNEETNVWRGGKPCFCHHCREIIMDYPLIEVGPITEKLFHTTPLCGAAAIEWQIKYDNMLCVIHGPDD